MSSFPAVTSSAQIKLPFDNYQLGADQDMQTLRANNLLLRQCGERFGVTITAPVGLNPTVQELNDRRYGIVDAAWAAAHGYRPVPSKAEIQPRGGWDPSPEESAVLNGPQDEPNEVVPTDDSGSPVPAGGCYAVAARELGSDEPPIQELGAGVYDRAQNDSRVQAAWARWSKCMSGKGYKYSSPWEPNNANWGQEVSRKEVSTALDDVACKQDSNLVGVWYAVEGAYQRRSIEDNPEQFKALADWREGRLKRVAAVLSGE